ncbi:MAG: stage V sporulation protein AD [Ruminococcaceae bacterium]|nr:stage V sporulation protein AD [Oscillospiraceae bacterium]
MKKRIGTGTFVMETPVSVLGFGSAAGKKEDEGPLSGLFDYISDDNTFGEKTWEKSESRMQQIALSKALANAELDPKKIDLIFSGDLLNQCIGSVFGLREFNIPFIGLYGACSTMAEGIALSCIAIDGGFAEKCAAITSSHFCSAERQFRLPLEYGGQRPQSAQWTATASGAVILGNSEKAPVITHVTIGTIVDMGINDANNMGAAMAPAAADTIKRFFTDTSLTAQDIDLVLTGDLGEQGSSILCELLYREGIDIRQKHNDCGLIIFDRESQDVHSGGSGCGCSAAVLCAHILPRLCDGNLKKVLFVATGALMSPTSQQQGETIPGIAHAVLFQSR